MSLQRHAAVLSTVLPGLGQAALGHAAQALLIVVVTALLLGGAWVLGWTMGVGAPIFFGMMIVLPWWSIQAYEAYLSGDASPSSNAFAPSASQPFGLRRTLGVVWQRAHDVRYLGALFLLTALTDLYIIVANPDYSLTVFCTKPAGLLGILAKAQSPTLHTLIGYGFLRLRRWSFLLYMAYAAFGLLNGTVNYACFGYGRVRTVFLVTLMAFTSYVFLRRRCFPPPQARSRGL